MYTLLYVYLYCRQWVDEMTAEVNSRNVLVEVPASRRMMISEESSVTPAIATATMALFTTNLDDVFISVKTIVPGSMVTSGSTSCAALSLMSVSIGSNSSLYAICLIGITC